MTLVYFYALAGPVLQEGDPQHAAALAPDLPAADVTALVPAPTLLDRRAFFLSRATSWIGRDRISVIS